MIHASVFSGIGGPEVAAAMLGWENVFHCEINPFGRAVLEYWFPNSKSYEDITTTDFSEWRGKIDVLTGGFPCQPFSYAGKRKGQTDDRYLWPYMFKCIDQIRPTWVVAENVGGITTMVEQGKVTPVESQTSLFGEGDEVRRYELRETFTLQRICNDLEQHGYSVQPVLIPACGVGAPHRRDRVFIIARRNDATDTDHDREVGESREHEGESRQEGLQERNEIQQPHLSDQVRSEGAAVPLDTNDGGSASQRPIQEGDSEPCGVCPGSGQVFAADTSDNGLQYRPEAGGQGSEAGEVQGQGNCPERDIPAQAAGCGGSSADTEDKYVQIRECGESESRQSRDGKPGRSGGEDSCGRNASDTEGERTGEQCEPGCGECGQPQVSEFGECHCQTDAERFASDPSCCGEGTPGQICSSQGDRCHQDQQPSQRGAEAQWDNRLSSVLRDDANSSINGLEGQDESRGEEGGQRMHLRGDAPGYGGSDYQEVAGLGRWANFPTQSPVHRGNDGLPFDVDDLTISFSKWRIEALKAYGNAIVPEVMYEIFRAIEITEAEYEK